MARGEDITLEVFANVRELVAESLPLDVKIVHLARVELNMEWYARDMVMLADIEITFLPQKESRFPLRPLKIGSNN